MSELPPSLSARSAFDSHTGRPVGRQVCGGLWRWWCPTWHRSLLNFLSAFSLPSILPRFASHGLARCRPPPHYLSSPVSPTPPQFTLLSSSSPLDLDVKASQAVWSVSVGCQGRDAAHWDPEWDKLTVTMFPLSMWTWEKEKVKREG